MKYDYTAFPLPKIDPVSKQDLALRPVLSVVLFANRKRTAPIRSIVDTGADWCIFHGQIGDSLGLQVRNGIEYEFSGVGPVKSIGYIHKVRMQVAGDSYETNVVFCYELSMVGLLGQVGFFDHFIATFDWTPNPPCFELQRIQRI